MAIPSSTASTNVVLGEPAGSVLGVSSILANSIFTALNPWLKSILVSVGLEKVRSAAEDCGGNHETKPSAITTSDRLLASSLSIAALVSIKKTTRPGFASAVAETISTL